MKKLVLYSLVVASVPVLLVSADSLKNRLQEVKNGFAYHVNGG